MSTYIQLVQDLHREVGAAGPSPVTVANQNGEMRRLVNWIRSADLYVQNLWFNWKFLFANPGYSQAATTNIATLAKPNGLGMWDLDTFRILEVGSTQPGQLLAYEYENVKSEILDTSPGAPWRVIVMPDNSLKLEGVPDAAHLITADYFKDPVELAAKDDVSLIPPKYHRIILGKALMLYGNFENAPEQLKQGVEIYDEMLEQLETHELPSRNYARKRTGGIFEVIGSQSGHDFSRRGH